MTYHDRSPQRLLEASGPPSNPEITPLSKVWTVAPVSFCNMESMSYIV